MNPVSRGIRNAFRSGVRTSAIVLILGLSIGLSLTMLVAQKAVNNKIKSVKSSIGNTISVAPAGFNPGAQANNALTTSDLDKVKTIAHVTAVAETLTDRQSTTGTSAPMFGRFGESADSSNQTTTGLSSPVTLNANGPRRFFAGGGTSDSGTAATFSLPVSFLGTSDTTHVNDTAITIASGKTLSGTADTNDALISQAMANKNDLKVGSTFTAYNATLNVAGIFTSGSTNSQNQGVDNTVVLALPALQRLSGQTDTVTSAVITVDSLDNLSSVTSSVKSTLGSNADVTSAQEQADDTVKPLNSVKKVASFSLVGAILAGAVIILLVMIMVVRERKKEIGVAKAIGGSNGRIIGEFMVEALTLAIMGAVIGLLIGVIGGQPVTKQLVDSSVQNTTTAVQGPGGRMFAMQRDGGAAPRFGSSFRAGLGRNSTVQGITNIKAQIGPAMLLEGFGAALLIAVLGSTLAAGMIAKVRPSTVMRAE